MGTYDRGAIQDLIGVEGRIACQWRRLKEKLKNANENLELS